MSELRIVQTIAFECAVCRQHRLPEIVGKVAQDAGLFGRVRYAVCLCGMLAPDPKDRNYRARYRRRVRQQQADFNTNPKEGV